MRGLQIIPIGDFHFPTKLKGGWKRSSSPVGSRLMQVGLFSFYFCFWNPDLFEQNKNWFHCPRGESFIDRPSHHQLRFFWGFDVLWHVQFILASFHDLTRPGPQKKVAEEGKSLISGTSSLVKYCNLDRFIIVSGEIKELSFSICFETWTLGTCTRPTENLWKVHSTRLVYQTYTTRIPYSQYTILLVYVTPHF